MNMATIERDLATRVAMTASATAKADLAKVRARFDAGVSGADHYADFGTLMAHVAILAEKIDALTEHNV